MNKKVTTIIVGIVLIGAAFYGGMKYGQSIRPAGFQARAGNFAFTSGGRTGRGGAGLAIGNILSVGSGSLTIQMQDGSSKIILLSNSTTVMKTVSGGTSDLIVGKLVSVNGTTNSDGSITAEMIQLRTATTTRAQ